MLILEGADLVGKTTLAKRLEKRLNELGWPHTYSHMSKLPTAWRGPRWCQNYLDAARPYAVQDRFHLSEPLYAAARGERPLVEDYELLDDCLRQQFGAFVVVVSASEELIGQRWHSEVEAKGREEMYKLGQILAVNRDFERVAEEKSVGGKRAHVDYWLKAYKCAPNFLDRELDVLLRAYLGRLSSAHSYAGASTP